jgi:hypothetical protein
MSQNRRSQWSRRLARLQDLKARYARGSSYERAYRAHLVIQQVYERWADEVFASAR